MYLYSLPFRFSFWHILSYCQQRWLVPTNNFLCLKNENRFRFLEILACIFIASPFGFPLGIFCLSASRECWMLVGHHKQFYVLKYRIRFLKIVACIYIASLFGFPFGVFCLSASRDGWSQRTIVCA